MTDVMAHASLVNKAGFKLSYWLMIMPIMASAHWLTNKNPSKHRQSKDSPSYNFWRDIFAYGESMANYHIGRLTMDCILAGRVPRTTKITDPSNSPPESVDPCR